MSKEDLIAAHDWIGDLNQSVETVDNYRAELARRDADERTRTMLSLTKWIAALTVVNVVLVAYSVLR